MNVARVPECWLVCGSQHLYGPEPLEQVADHGRLVAAGLDQAESVPLPVRFRGVVTTPDEIREVCLEANADPSCAGLVVWMHTFSPARMWIAGLRHLRKPLCHLHTQFHQALPWDALDMDYMNLHQAAHGDREAGYLHTRMRLGRTVVVGHWSDPELHVRLAAWMGAARAWHDLQGARFARFGDIMRGVAVTGGDTLSAQLRFGVAVDGFGVGDLVERVRSVRDADVDELVATYEANYAVAAPLRRSGERAAALWYAARLEIGLRAFLEEGGFAGFTTTFEDLHGLEQLPGLAVQRLMGDGYGFAAEGDWKTAVLVRALKVMGRGGSGGTSFMEDYTYHLDRGKELVLGAHMLEVCPSIARDVPSVEVHPLGIGGKADPVRLVFDANVGAAINASLVDVGNRFRLIVNEVRTVEHPMLPKLPVARAVWTCEPDFATACEAWIRAGGAHHTALSFDVTTAHLEAFAEIAGVELVVIDRHTTLRALQQALRLGEVYYALKDGLGGW